MTDLAQMIGPGGTAGTFAGPTGVNDAAKQTANDSIQQLMRMISMAAQQKSLPTPVPAPIPQQQQGIEPNPRSSGERAVAGIMTGIQNAWAQHKQKQLASAESDWNNLLGAMQSGNQDALNFILQDPKKLKNMAKALNQDWLNPEKTDVYGEALKSALAKHQQKQEAMHGLKALFGHLIQKAQQPQLNQDQKQQMEQEILKRAPVTQSAANPKDEADLMRAFAEVTKAQNEAKDKFAVVSSATGRMYAYDKSDPKTVIPLTDEKGEPITSAPKAGQAPKVVSVGGIPFGVSRDGKTITPDSSDWTPKDAEMFNAAKAAAATAQQNKMSLADQVTKSRTWAYMSTREYPIIDKATGEMTYATPAEINANKGKYAPAAGGAAAMSKQAVMGDIQFNIDNSRDAILGLKNGFDTKQRAQISILLRSTDPHSAMETFINSDIAKTLTEDQVNYITSLASLQENAMALRSVAGMGQGSDDLRAAIMRAIPGAGTPSTDYALKQLQLFQGTLDRLKRGVPGVTKPDAGMETQVHNGFTYQRKKGSNDPWTLQKGTN